MACLGIMDTSVNPLQWHSGSEERTNFWRAWGKQRILTQFMLTSYEHNSCTLLETAPQAVSFQGLVVSSCYNITGGVFQCHVGFLKPAPKLDSPGAQPPSGSDGHSHRCPAWYLLARILFPFVVLCNHLFSCCFTVLFSALTLQRLCWGQMNAWPSWITGIPSQELAVTQCH